MTDIIITIIGITAVLALVIFIAYKGITSTPKTGNQHSGPRKRRLQRPRKGFPSSYGFRHLGKSLDNMLLSISNYLHWPIIVAFLIISSGHSTQAKRSLLPGMLLYALNRGWAEVSPGSLRPQSYFHASYHWYANRFQWMNITDFDPDNLWESWSGPSPSVMTRHYDHEEKDWDFKYYHHEQFAENVRGNLYKYEMKAGEEFKHPDGGWISHAVTKTYSMTYRIISYYRREGRAPGMPDTYRVTLDYRLEDLSYDENGLSRVTRDEWEKSKYYNMSGTSKDVAHMDILEHGEGLVNSETSGFVKRKRQRCWTTDMTIVPCVVETCSGQPCTWEHDMFRRGVPTA